jgi:FAD/FMN-containing dehydrogenase
MFRAFEGIMMRHGGRPHWAKEHGVSAEQLRGLYPRWDQFLNVRQALDPEGVFLNDYLSDLLGVQPPRRDAPRARL